MNSFRTPKQWLSASAAVCLIIVCLVGGFYVVLVKAPSDLSKNSGHGIASVVDGGYERAKRLGRDIFSAFNVRPQITVNGTTVIQASVGIAELSFIKKQFEHTYTWEHSWLKSTKTIRLSGQFIAKVGYDLNEPFSISLDENGNVIGTVLPPSKITSIEPVNIDILQDENGFWNKISSEDREMAINAFLEEARKSLDKDELLAESDSALLSRVTQIIQKHTSAGMQGQPSPLP